MNANDSAVPYVWRHSCPAESRPTRHQLSPQMRADRAETRLGSLYCRPGGQPPVPDQGVALQPVLVGDEELVRRPVRMLASAAANIYPSSCALGFRPRFSAPMTEVVMPEECQSMPITAPSA